MPPPTFAKEITVITGKVTAVIKNQEQLTKSFHLTEIK